MAGVEWDLARDELKVPERFRFEAGCVIGRRGGPETLDERLREREVPSGDASRSASLPLPGNFSRLIASMPRGGIGSPPL